MHVGVIFACTLINSNTGTSWDARAPGLHAYAPPEQGAWIQIHCLDSCGGVRRQKSRMLTCCALRAAAYAWPPATLQLNSRQLMSVPSVAGKSCSNPVLRASYCCALRSETCAHHAILPISRRHRELDRGRRATTQDALSSYSLFYDALPHHSCFCL